jgi:UDP-glucose:(heptosyl)LPS alpha-1,3-glucosyltransferase
MILSFLINSGRAIRNQGFDIVHGVGRSLAMNVFNPHGGVEKAYLAQEFRSIGNRSYRVYQKMKRYLSLQHYLKVWIQRNQVLGSDVKRIIAISTMVKDDLIRCYGVPEPKITVIVNCVDLKRFHPKHRDAYRAVKRKALDIDEGTLVLLFAGNNYRLKGLDPLLQALVLLRQRYQRKRMRLLVAGRGRISRYERVAERLGLSGSVSFLGSVREMEQYYATSDIYVHPTFYDPCSLTVLEALASGLPVITTRFNGAADVMISDRGGKVIDDPMDVVNLAESIALFIDEDRRREAGVVAREWMERYPPSRHVEELLRVYHEIAG